MSIIKCSRCKDSFYSHGEQNCSDCEEELEILAAHTWICLPPGCACYTPTVGNNDSYTVWERSRNGYEGRTYKWDGCQYVSDNGRLISKNDPDFVSSWMSYEDIEDDFNWKLAYNRQIGEVATTFYEDEAHQVANLIWLENVPVPNKLAKKFGVEYSRHFSRPYWTGFKFPKELLEYSTNLRFNKTGELENWDCGLGMGNIHNIAAITTMLIPLNQLFND